MRAAIYNPYFDTLGGGERYALAFAVALQKYGYEVFVQWESASIKNKLENRFGIDLAKIAVIKNVNKGEGYDICFWVSDGSIPLLRARKNILHFQIPFQNVDGKSLINRMKMFRINKVLCNSNFTKTFVDNEFGINSEVLFPPVDVKSFKPKIKQNVILSVGRFSQLTQSKNQHILIESFKSMSRSGLKGWRLVLAGGADVGADQYLLKLKKFAKGYPIEIIESPSFNEIRNLYGVSKIFWSAVGFGVDEMRDPKKVEHFGIAVVESMVAGCVPIVSNLGGHKETVKNNENGLLWNKKSELTKKTLQLIDNPKELLRLSRVARVSAENYSYEKFNYKVGELVR